MVYVDQNDLVEINKYLEEGWNVISMATAVRNDSIYSYGVYVVIEKNDI